MKVISTLTIASLLTLPLILNSCDDNNDPDSTVVSPPNDGNDDNEPRDPFDEVITDEQAAQLVRDYVGRTVEQARSLAETQRRPFRIVKLDGEYLAVTADISIGRINATVVENIVTEIAIEGYQPTAEEIL